MKLQLTPSFPANIVGNGLISVSLANGVLTIGLAAPEPTQVNGDATIANKSSAIAIVRNAPVTTNLQLPSIANQGGIPLRIFDWSAGVVNHQINLTPFGAEKIMNAAAYALFSTAQQLASVMLYPSTSLNGWYIAP